MSTDEEGHRHALQHAESSLITRSGILLRPGKHRGGVHGAEEVGLYIIEQGRAQIVYTHFEAHLGNKDRDQDAEGHKRTVISEIGRGDTFGGTSILR